MPRSRTLIAVLLAGGLAGPLLTTAAVSAPAAPAPEPPLSGISVVIDPGHQLGNSRHPQQINRPVEAGGFTKPCNTTGTATNAGFPEATFNFRVAVRLRDRLRGLGAQVTMTRRRNSVELWGPCVDVRGRLGNQGFRDRPAPADLKISIHADGSAGAHRGFHVIVATKKQSRAASLRLARATRHTLGLAGFPRSNYIGGGTALDRRGDLATLNLSRIPTILVELGNMRNRADAAAMRSAEGQRRYAKALTRGVRRYLDR